MIKAFWSRATLMAAAIGALFVTKGSRTYTQAADASRSHKSRSLLACNPLALSSGERTRHFNELGPALRSLKMSVRELDNGYEFEFPGDRATLQLLAEWVTQERECCPFFEITLRLEPDQGVARLRLTGREGAKMILKVGLAAELA
jgi:hypothetical protein